jgi:Asp-tRNA(Asn)/Glu-tRNA(Gln) amidotransferase A subunit family amidase
MDKIKNYFPNEFDLTREEPDFSDSKPGKKPSKVRLVHPSLYVYEGPEGLAKAVKELQGKFEDGFYVLAFVKPTRLSETMVIDRKGGEKTEETSLDLEVHKICLPDEDNEEFSDEDAEEERDEMKEMAKAAKAAGVKGVEVEISLPEGESEAKDEE